MTDDPETIVLAPSVPRNGFDQDASQYRWDNSGKCWRWDLRLFRWVREPDRDAE